MDWTDERVQSLKDLYAQGLSAARIARALGNISRNAVIGKIHRLGILRGGVPVQTQRIKRPANLSASEPKPPPRPRAIAVPEPASMRVELVDIRDGMCRWPSEEAPYTYCGHACTSVYCDFHNAVAHQTPHLVRASVA